MLIRLYAYTALHFGHNFIYITNCTLTQLYVLAITSSTLQTVYLCSSTIYLYTASDCSVLILILPSCHWLFYLDIDCSVMLLILNSILNTRFTILDTPFSQELSIKSWSLTPKRLSTYIFCPVLYIGTFHSLLSVILYSLCIISDQALQALGAATGQNFVAVFKFGLGLIYQGR